MAHGLIVATRLHHEPICVLPQERQRPVDDHHLIWPGPDMHQLGLGDARNLPCAIQKKFDSMTHTLSHQRFWGITRPPAESSRRQLHRQGLRLVQRHYDRICACHRRKRLHLIDALTLQPLLSRSLDRPRCITMEVDAELAELMRHFYTKMAAVSPSIYIALERRHSHRACSCYRR